MIQTGQQAPDFTLPASNGTDVSLSDYHGKNVVLYFYPKDMTPGCTAQACDFRDAYDVFQAQDTVIIGISPDPLDKHAKFIGKYSLPFLLLADEQQTAAQLYDVWRLKKNFGKEYMGIERSTFLIDKEGNLVREWRKVKVKNHAEEVADYIRTHLS
ncbi:thioredoxin-dependent thiol peroxidase [Ectobacillus sp. SYSU M60031]|uniref:thioredoxin-dependent peroxiredoxin n=1 Tax=Ectobacillus ponti TaxID=2961894 RepID=A0AA42BR48_9BACI|nr:thioredoxin-dependent thiol peroxidase [Ectobacillus ponti]